MRIISLNIFVGHKAEAILDFVRSEKEQTDVFCFQEMLSNPKEDISNLPFPGQANILEQLTRALPEFNVSFAPAEDDWNITPEYPGQMKLGIAIFYKKTLDAKEAGNFFIYNDRNSYKPGNYETQGHNAAYLTIGSENPLTILTLHGNSQPPHKLDTEKRLLQSQKVVDFLAARKGEKIVMGDFNLMPETESIRMFEQAGYTNLIKEFAIKTTRGSLMRKLFPEYETGPYGFQEFADYTFVTKGITVKSFSVPDLPLSDHLPMILEFDI